MVNKPDVSGLSSRTRVGSKLRIRRLKTSVLTSYVFGERVSCAFIAVCFVRAVDAVTIVSVSFFFCGGWYPHARAILRLPAKVTLQSIRSVVRPPQFVNWKWLPPPYKRHQKSPIRFCWLSSFIYALSPRVCEFTFWLSAAVCRVLSRHPFVKCRVLFVCVCARDCKSIFGRPGCACIVARWRICIAGPGAD